MASRITLHDICSDHVKSSDANHVRNKQKTALYYALTILTYYQSCVDVDIQF